LLSGYQLTFLVELILDSGEKKIVKAGDIAIQRQTMHAWRNTSKTAKAKMFFVLISSKELKIGGHVLGDEYPHGQSDAEMLKVTRDKF
jgi:glutamate dehydrogenase/leucine dehydrogenase